MFTSKVECSFDLSRLTNSSLFSIAPGDASPLKETCMTVMMIFWGCYQIWWWWCPSWFAWLWHGWHWHGWVWKQHEVSQQRIDVSNSRHTWGRALCTRHRVQFLPPCTFYHVSILQHHMIFISIIFISFQLRFIRYPWKWIKIEARPVHTSLHESFPLNWRLLQSGQNDCLYTDWLQHIPWHRSCAQLPLALNFLRHFDFMFSSNPF